jgi:hypothetical protein
MNIILEDIYLLHNDSKFRQMENNSKLKVIIIDERREVMKYGLPDITLNTFDSIFRAYPGIREDVLYGSRANGNYRRSSDIDISL